jgi:hypothetical protein
MSGAAGAKVSNSEVSRRHCKLQICPIGSSEQRRENLVCSCLTTKVKNIISLMFVNVPTSW